MFALSASLVLVTPLLAEAGLFDTVKEGFIPKRKTQTASTAARGIDEEEPGAGRYARDTEAIGKMERLSRVEDNEIRAFVKEGGLKPEKKP